ncbi:MAG: inositol-3-phosphate synthase [Planctomycetes bacterium]|nr:inositol-3-phosphate synthase [Planctomycetota bacterium]
MTASSNGSSHNRERSTGALCRAAAVMSSTPRGPPGPPVCPSPTAIDDIATNLRHRRTVAVSSSPHLAKTRQHPSFPEPPRRLGVWLFGAYGGLATTVVVGARAIARRLAPARGMVTETVTLAGVPLAPIDGLVFGGHEVRTSDWAASAFDIWQHNNTLPWPMLQQLAPELRRLSKNVRRGLLVNAGRTIDDLVEHDRGERAPLRTQVDRAIADIRAFLRRNRLRDVVCVNLTSTEPALAPHAAHRSLAAFEQAIDRDNRKAVRPSALYAYVAASVGAPFVHFTPSDSALLPAIQQKFAQTGAPFMGADGKTGETLVKSALAPMFHHRDLRVLSWQGYNILGDRDGQVLAHDENKRTKVASKDALLPSILGYPLHTHVGIDCVPSLHDLKTAWDFIHFEGFLGHKMAMQFIWQGCDAILAAPLVLDMVRLANLAHRRGENGPMPQLACFFKTPFGVAEHDLHRQWQMLTDWLAGIRRDLHR